MDSPNKELKCKQVGGTHYKGFEIEPLEFIERNNIGFASGNVIKYVCRAPFKNGLEDLLKAKHYLEYLIAVEETKKKNEDDLAVITPLPKISPCSMHDAEISKTDYSFDNTRDK